MWTSATAAFAAAAEGLTEGGLRAPSRLPGWSRAHVIAHVVLNAEGFVAVADALRAGRPAFMYASVPARDRAIDALASSTRATLLRRLAEADEAFRAAWDPAPPPGRGATADGDPTFASTAVPLRRLRELQVHLLDLGLDGIGPDDWLPSFVDADLPLEWPTVAHRTEASIAVVDERGGRWTVGTGDPATIVRVPRAHLLAWVLDRGAIEGLPALSPWGNRSRWEHLDVSQPTHGDA